MSAPRPDACPSCASPLVQPLRWSDGVVAFRCPECHSCFRAACSPADLRALEGRQAASRAALVADYERAVVASLEAREVRSADDFTPRAPEAP